MDGNRGTRNPPGMSPLLLLCGIFAAGHLLAVIGRAVSRRRDSHRIGGGEEGKHFLVLCSKGTIHDAINDGVDGTAAVPQAGGKEKNLERETNEKKKRQYFILLAQIIPANIRKK